MTLADINALDRDAFVARFGFLYEHSPWVVEQAEARRPFADLAGMKAALRAVVREAGRDAQLALLRAHPTLAGRAAIDRTLTEASTAEQASAGLDRLSPAEYEEFHALNAAYSERLAIPFIICVRLTDKAGILAAMRERTKGDAAGEIAIALDEVDKIVALRLAEALA